MPNGLTVLFRPKPDSKIVSVRLTVKAGLSSEGRLRGTGITHFVEHMIFKGAPARPAGAIEKKLKSYGARMNAATGLDTTSFFVTLPKEHCGDALELIADVLMNPGFNEEEFKNEQSVILSEIQMRNDDPSSRALRLLFENAYMRHSYRFPIIGYKDLFLRLTRNDLMNYHKERYCPNNMVLAIAGDFEEESTLNEISGTFGKYERKFLTPIVNEIEPEQITERISLNYAELNLGYIAMGFHSTGFLDDDLFAVDILSMIAGAGDSSRLNESLVKDKQILYSVSSGNYTPFYPGLFIITGVGDTDNLEKAKDEILNELRKIKEGGITPQEYEKVKANVIAGHLESLETVEGVTSSMADSQIFTGNPDFALDYIEGIKRTSLEDVVRAADKYLRKENCTVVYLMPKSKIQNPKQIQSTNSKTEAEKYELPNGIRVILKEERGLPLVSVTFSCLGGLRAEPDKLNGISNLTAQMLLKGTSKRKEDEIKGAMENLGGSISAFSGFNSLGLSLNFMSKDTDFALGLMEDVVKNANFPKDELEKLKKKTIVGIKMEDDDMFLKGMIEFRKNLFKNSPYGNRVSGKIDTIEKIVRSDMSRFYDNILNPKSIVITCVGDFDKETMLADIKRKFSSIKTNNYFINVKEKPETQKKYKEILSMPKEEALFMIGFEGCQLKNNDRYVLEVIASIMSGSNGRLYDSIRNKLGLSYMQGVFSLPGIDPGYFLLYAAVDKQNLEKAESVLLDEISAIKKKAVSDEELTSAKNALINANAVSLQTNEAKSFQMALDELYSLGHDNYERYKENILKCTKDDIIRVANKYFDLDKSVCITILPSKEKSG